MILAGDIGGTKTELAIFKFGSEPLFQKRFLNSDHASLSALIKQFFNEAALMPNMACLAVAGTIRDGRCSMPNLPWLVDATELASTFDLREVRLINDLEATAHGMLSLPTECLAVINPGNPDYTGNMALIAAGTGLGEAILLHHRDGYIVSPSEGGHTDFAPQDTTGIDLLRYLQARFGHVSWERVVSGPGLTNIYDFLSLTGCSGETSRITERIANSADRSAAIAEAALAGESTRANQALDLFIRAYGAEAGNLALKSLSTGGLYIGGGIAPKLASRLLVGDFMQAFSNKGRFADLLADIPVWLILEPRTALLGAAAYINQSRPE